MARGTGIEAPSRLRRIVVALVLGVAAGVVAGLVVPRRGAAQGARATSASR